MIWQNMQHVWETVDEVSVRNQQSAYKYKIMPSERWGHSSVAAYDKMFIIGGYQGKQIIQLKIVLKLAKEITFFKLDKSFIHISSIDRSWL